jgi:uncharacterized membrane protein YfcA
MEIWSYAVMAAALAGGAVIKGATGMGLPLVALPVLTAVFGLQHAVSVLTIPLLASNLWQVWLHRGVRADRRLRFMPLLLAGGAIGIVGGTWLLVSVPERLLQVVLGAMLLVYVVIRLGRPNWTVGDSAARGASFPVGLGAGALQGATGISAPLSVTFVHAMRLEREAHVFAVSAIFLLFSMVQVPALMVSGVMRGEWLLQGVLALVPILLFMPVGQWLGTRFSAVAFDRLTLVFLCLIGLQLLAGL